MGFLPTILLKTPYLIFKPSKWTNIKLHVTTQIFKANQLHVSYSEKLIHEYLKTAKQLRLPFINPLI